MSTCPICNGMCEDSKATIFDLPAPRVCIIGYTLRLTGVVSLLAFVLPLAASVAPRQQLSGGHVPAAAARLAPAGRLHGEQRLKLAIGLPLRNEQELDALLHQLYDPTSPNYRRYLTPEEFTARFGPTENDYKALMDFAKSNGLTVTVTHPNRLVLDVFGAVSDIERTFHLALRVYQHPTQARTFYAPDVEPSVDFALPILHISGLDNYSLPHPSFKVRPGGAVANATPNYGTGPGATYRGSDFRKAYVPGTTLTGAGQRVGLLQFDGFYASDIKTYESQAGLPNVPLTVVPIDGGVGTPGSDNEEVCLDLEMVISMAPGLGLVYLYEAPKGSPWVDLLSRMANDNLAKQFSCSWTGGSPDASAEQIFKQMGAQGQSFFNAAGDSDAFTGSIPFPSDSPNITVVGGTTLTTDSGGSYSSERVWNWDLRNGSFVGSSGGISTYYGIPFYQQGISMSGNQGSTTMRNVPDVALTADNVYVVYGNGKTDAQAGGTSCAAPLWAGFTALINQQAAASGQAPVGFLNPAIYTIGKGGNYTTVFHDITTGNNFSSSSTSKFAAATGYDLCTGWGTPNGTNLIIVLAVLAPSIISQPQNQTVTVGSTVTFSVAASGSQPLSYQWGRNGVNISGATSASYTIANVQTSQAGSYTVVVSNAGGTATSAAAVLTVNVLPYVTAQPQSQTVTAGNSVSFSVTASGTAPLSYQWYRNGSAVAGATATSYTISATQPSDAGDYKVRVNNVAGNVDSVVATLTVQFAPVITGQPQSQTVIFGNNVTFAVTAGGVPAPSYQWRFNGNPILSASQASYAITGVRTNDAGSYDVMVSNNFGSVTSAVATLVVRIPPAITQQPLSLVATQGSSASFSVSASGDAPLSYQWRFNGADIPTATGASLALTSVQVSQAGTYAVVVTNAFGSVVSSNAVLTVNPVCVAPPSGLVGWWPGDGSANDSVGTNNGMLENGVMFVLGEVGQAFLFDGTQSYVQVPDSLALSPELLP